MIMIGFIRTVVNRAREYRGQNECRRILGASGASAGPGYPLQFLSPCGASGISASIPCAAQNRLPWRFWAVGLLRKPRDISQPASMPARLRRQIASMLFFGCGFCKAKPQEICSGRPPRRIRRPTGRLLLLGTVTFMVRRACVTSADRTALDGLLYCAPCRPGCAGYIALLRTGPPWCSSASSRHAGFKSVDAESGQDPVPWR
jgi:hypothetical protein